MKANQSRSARRALDRRFAALPSAVEFVPPPLGWIRAIREALGMSAADLAARLGIATASVNDIERSEKAGRIRLDTLERAAAALGCDLVYALVPRVSLDEMVNHQARAKVEVHVQAVSRAMDLEAQSTELDAETVEDEMRRLIDSGRLWK